MYLDVYLATKRGGDGERERENQEARNGGKNFLRLIRDIINKRKRNRIERERESERE
jgi:hypothetical protein